MNDVTRLEYDRNIRLPGHQREFLDKMDEDMAGGFELAGELVASPNPIQRAQFVTMQLLMAMQREDEGLIAASCAYLANRYPEMTRVVATEQGEQISFNLLFNEEPLQNAVAVNFEPKLH